MLIINLRICLWEWVEVFISNKCKYKHELDNHEMEN